MDVISPSSTSQSSGGKQHRKSISTGGGRAWSHEEENYLIETRMHKMPYKHIATTLKKTELACRLHYHQLSFGTKRRRRTASVASVSYTSSPITPAEGTRQENQQQQYPLPSISTYANLEPPKDTAQSLFRSPQTHIPILPKPKFSRPALPSTRGLRLITEGLPAEGVEPCEKKSVVDTARLDKIYKAHKQVFWSKIARDYGSNVSPTTLEQAWCKAHDGNSSKLPPTPSDSPDESSRIDSSPSVGVPFSAVAEYSQGFTCINNPIAVPKSAVAVPFARKGSFAISSLLTEDKEVRSPS
ncbi:MAG: hypothetical protein Q9201_001494 [Fulgogasparrea decipioides]